MFRNSVKIFPRFIQKVLYEHDISGLNLDINTTQTLILMFVNESNDKSMSEISRLTGLEKSSFTRSVDYLVENGFIAKNYPEHDRRKIRLSLTGKGAKAAKLIQNDFDRYLESLISHFSESEKKEFFKSLTAMSKYINRIFEAN